MLDMLKTKSKNQSVESSVSNDDIAAVLSKKVESFRFVTLRAESCCGCGCSDIKIKRKVPEDSHLQDDDYVGSDIQSDDEIL